MRFHAYLNFDGNCAEAMRHYASVLGGELEVIPFAGTPAAEHVPAEQADRVMHAALKIGEELLMASDAPPGRFQHPAGTYVSVMVDTVEEGKRIFDGLSKGGQIEMPFQPTFWSPGFASFVDRFGTPWMVNCTAPVEEASSSAAAKAGAR